MVAAVLGAAGAVALLAAVLAPAAPARRGWPSGWPPPCTPWAGRWSQPDQLEFDCPGYASGTSGSPLLARVDPRTVLGTVLGVIGGYQLGSLTSSVSYAARPAPRGRPIADRDGAFTYVVVR